MDPRWLCTDFILHDTAHCMRRSTVKTLLNYTQVYTCQGSGGRRRFRGTAATVDAVQWRAKRTSDRTSIIQRYHITTSFLRVTIPLRSGICKTHSYKWNSHLWAALDRLKFTAPSFSSSPKSLLTFFTWPIYRSFAAHAQQRIAVRIFNTVRYLTI